MAKINAVEIGERIKKQRLLNGYSREKLAEMTNITPRYCYDIELGLKNMSLNTLFNMSESLNVSTDYILFDSRDEDGEYYSVINIIKKCPLEKLSHLEQIISHYIQAVNDMDKRD